MPATSAYRKDLTKEARRGKGRLGRGKMGRAQKSRANKKNMRKTTKKGAYKKGAKKMMAIRRAPLVETFKYQSAPATNESQYMSITSAYNNILNRAFVAAFTQSLDIPNDGLSTNSNEGPTCRGRDVFSKLTSMKLRFDFPEDEFMIRDNYTPPTLYHGWIKKTMYKTGMASQEAPAVITEQHFITKIDEALEGQFNEANDKLDFADKVPTQYVILGKQQIKPNRNKSISLAQTVVVGDVDSGGPAAGDPFTSASGVFGSLPPVFKKVTWHTNRKLQLQHSTQWSSGDNRFYPSNTWIPFVMVFNPSFVKQIPDGEQTSRGQIHVGYNSVHYYTDS